VITLRSRLGRAAVGLLAAVTLAGCAQVVDGTPRAGSAPDAHLSIRGSNGGAFDVQAANALSDVEAFWRATYPSVSNGKPLPPLKGSLYSIDGARVLATRTIPAYAKHEGCLHKQPSFIIDNAAYCELDDSILWDRSPGHLLPALAKRFGTTVVALVFAHEFGHAIQQRLGINKRNLQTIYLESQADCAAGAFIAWAMKGHAPHFHVTQADLDRALDGYLLIRDSTPESPTDISHGNGFDRLNALQDGITHGATYCYSAHYFASRNFTERGFIPDTQDQADQGNEPLSAVLDPTTPSKTNTAAGGLQPDLDRFWTAAGKTIGKTFQPVSFTEADHPACGSASASSQFGYCPDDNTVYYSSAIAKTAYYSMTDLAVSQSNGDVSVANGQPGDFALGQLISIAWGMAAEHQFFGHSVTDRKGLLAAVCYAGAYAQNINHEIDPNGPANQFVLSPPDMDEATSATLNLVPLNEVFGRRGTSGLERIHEFVTGYAGGLSSC